MVIDEEDAIQGETRKVFRENPHTTWDNYFCGDIVMKWMGQNGFGETMSCWNDRLPSGVPDQYLHKKKNNTKAQSKADRFNHPINMRKVVPAVGLIKSYQRIHTSVQLIPSCNI